MIATSKVALVTGASRGIGAAIAKRLATDGFTVVINYAGSVAAAEQLAGDIEKAGSKALTIQADVSDPKDVVRMFDSAEAAFGGIDVLVNNAGIMKLAKLADSDDDLVDSQIAINLKGTINTLREASRRLRDGGRIVSLSTSVVGLKLETYGVYAATKAAVETLTGTPQVPVPDSSQTLRPPRRRSTRVPLWPRRARQCPQSETRIAPRQ